MRPLGDDVDLHVLWQWLPREKLQEVAEMYLSSRLVRGLSMTLVGELS